MFHSLTAKTTLLMAAILAFLVVLSNSASTFAQDIQPRLTDPGWQASYWNNRDLSGNPTVVRTDRDLNFAWGTGSPDPAIPVDRFSARWYRYIDVAEGNYRFNTLSDDGIRLWVDGQLLIDQWTDHGTLAGSATKILAAGVHLVQVEYYENVGAATVRVEWMQADTTPPTPTPTPTPLPPPPPPSFNNWKGEYFNNKSTSGTPAYTRDDVHINFDWGIGSPAPGVNADHFSVRWVRTVNFAPGNYRFSLYVDDGARLFVNGHTTIDAWRDQPATLYTGDIYVAGPTTLQLEYFEGSDRALAQLSWQQLGGTPPTATPPAPPPPGGAVIVDDRDANFARGGSERGWVYQNDGYNSSLTWTQNNDYARPNYNWGRWYPTLGRGYYEVFVYIPDRFSTTGRATYWVSHAGGLTKRVVNQSANGDRWVSLGSYLFQGNRNDYLSLADVTGERYLSRLVAWDAAKWEPR